MTRRATVWIVLLIVAAMTGPIARAQQSSPAAPKPTLVPLEVEVVLSRYQGEKKVSSIPYTLNVNANGAPTSMNMGTEVPVPATIIPPTQGGQTPNAVRSY